MFETSYNFVVLIIILKYLCILNILLYECEQFASDVIVPNIFWDEIESTNVVSHYPVEGEWIVTILDYFSSFVCNMLEHRRFLRWCHFLFLQEVVTNYCLFRFHISLSNTDFRSKRSCLGAPRN